MSIRRAFAAVVATGIGAVLLVALWMWMSEPAGPVPWSRLGTEDVHSLDFGESTEHLLFGHHGGVLESTDGGRSWRQLGARADAMSLAVANSSMVIAGHYVLQESTDGGRTWRDIKADLPDLDIHAFARSTSDPSRMWAYLAQGGVYESIDGGRTWQQVTSDHVAQLVPVAGVEGEALLGVHPRNGLVRSEDGGRNWSFLSLPPVAPVTSLAATPSEEAVFVGGPRGLHRSDDGGRSWRQLLDVGTVLALAVSDDGATVAVTSQTNFYRSDDRGMSWPGP